MKLNECRDIKSVMLKNDSYCLYFVGSLNFHNILRLVYMYVYNVSLGSHLKTLHFLCNNNGLFITNDDDQERTPMFRFWTCYKFHLLQTRTSDIS